MDGKELIEIKGSVDSVVFRNDDTGFMVLELDYGGHPLTVVGELPGVQEGELLSVHGYHTSHPTYGAQFKAEAFERSLPEKSNAIKKYLASGAIKGIGPVIAERLVEHFGDDTLEIMEKSPLRLHEINGISPKKAAAIAESFKKMFSIRQAMLFLSKHNISASESIKAWKLLGVDCVEIIRNNPYKLCHEELGVAFERADAIAAGLGLDMLCPSRLVTGVEFILRHNAQNGHSCLPYQKLVKKAVELLETSANDIEDAISGEIESGGFVLVSKGDIAYIYLPQFYNAETYIAARIRLMERIVRDTTGTVGGDGIAALEERLGIQYADKQRRAIRSALSSSVFVLTGGPGTGKTTTLNAVISLFEESGLKVALTAPTGRAAKRMTELTGHEAKTIHRLLEAEFNRQTGRSVFNRNEKNPLVFDVVIVDEVSMVDILLCESLLKAMKLDCRLILVGDTDQLPSVGCGNVLGDIIASDKVSTIRLTDVFRQAAQSLIVTNAHAIVKGGMPDLIRKDGDFFFMKRAGSDIPGTVIELCTNRLPTAYGFSPFTDIQVIAPSRKGATGTAEINMHLQRELNPPSRGKTEYVDGSRVFREGDKIMQIKNNYEIIWKNDENMQGAGIFNGDIGVIELIDRPSRSMLVKYDDKLAEYSFDMTDELEHAYAITVHKSQGSEFEAVVLPVADMNSRLFFRNLLYTAITRAKKILIIVGSQQAVARMVNNDRKALRYTGLREFLRNNVDF